MNSKLEMSFIVGETKIYEGKEVLEKRKTLREQVTDRCK
jgi:hypothetical protein